MRSVPQRGMSLWDIIYFKSIMKNQLVETFSGIKGVYGKSLTDDVAEKYARVYADYLKAKFKNGKIKFVVGSDTRKSGPELKKIFVNEFLNQGFEVIDIGLTGTPQVELGVREHKAQGGVMITASHNQPEFNGWKLLGNNGAILGVKEINLIINRVHNF